MPGSGLKDLFAQLAALSVGRRLALALVGLGSLAFFGYLVVANAAGSYRVLYRDLPDDQMAKLVDALDAERIAYRLEPGGAILVPRERVPEARIRLAEKGLPSCSGIGFELFDRPGFGVTDFVHRVNYQRALQGELARSIEQLDPVDRARVQLALPERSPFVGEGARQPSASVVVRVAPGQELEAPQVSAIVHLVASSVESLKPENVSVVDDRGRLLSARTEGALGEGAPAGARSYQTRLERELASRIESMLEPMVGAGRVVAKVSADLDWTETETTEERFDPDSQIERSQQKSEEKSSDGSGGGVPGARANLPGEAGPAAQGSTSSNVRTSETINYELSKLVTRSRSGVAKVKRITAGVLMDGKPGAEGGAFTPWDPQELQRFEGLARQAIGFSEQRGDQIVVSSAPFRSVELGDDPGGSTLSPDLVFLGVEVARYSLLIAAVAALGFLVVRPLARSLAPQSELALPARVEDLERLAAGAAGGGVAYGGGGEGGAAGASGVPIGARKDEAVRTLKTWLKEG
jgi:flagellar M-ring protein FliF